MSRDESRFIVHFPVAAGSCVQRYPFCKATGWKTEVACSSTPRAEDRPADGDPVANFALLDIRAWVYYFSRQRTGSGVERLRAYHGAELPYVFNQHESWLPTDETDPAVMELGDRIRGHGSIFHGSM